VALVLSGRLRLLLGTHDLLLEAGEVVEFDTCVPHWVANPGPGHAEALTLFGPRASGCTSAPGRAARRLSPRRNR
jgi:mannose-6-phosphate isomerase-like protein (cupin superfamily)